MPPKYASRLYKGIAVPKMLYAANVFLTPINNKLGRRLAVESENICRCNCWHAFCAPVQGRRDRWIRSEEPYACLSVLRYLHQFKHALWKSTQSQAIPHTPLVVFGPPTWYYWIDSLPSSMGLLVSIATWFTNSLCALLYMFRSIVFTFELTQQSDTDILWNLRTTSHPKLNSIK